MAGQAFQRVELLFNQAVSLPVEKRAGFLEAACGTDTNLRTAVEELLKHDRDDQDTEPFLVSPIVRTAGDDFASQPTRLFPPDAPEVEVRAAVARSWPQIPGYEIRSELGRGGMGVVYRARQTNLNREVALKMVLPSYVDSPQQLARFKTEAEALGRLSHPNIVPIYEIGTFEDRPFFTMEYVAGPNLAQFLAGRPQEVKSAARTIETLARAIHVVHQCGIVHRDLKPANVLLQKDEGGQTKEESKTLIPSDSSIIHSPPSFRPKITDFGIAKDQTAGRRLTTTGAVLGTPCYMAPEQVRTTSKGVGPAADIYALGSILYEMMTGRPPFDAESATETIGQLVDQEPLSPVRLRPRLPADLVTICLKCLEKAPGKRYASALDLADDLHRFQVGEPIKARPIRFLERTFRRCRRHPVIAGLITLSGMLALALIVTIVVYSVLLRNALTKAEALAEQERQQIVLLHVSLGIVELDKGKNYTAVLHFAEALQLDEGDFQRELPHRQRIAAALREPPAIQPGLAAQEEAPAQSLNVETVPWSIKLANGASVQVAQPSISDPLMPAQGSDRVVKQAVFSPDARRVAVRSKDGSVRIWDTASGEPVTPPLRHRVDVVRAAFSLDGLRLITAGEDGSVRVWDANRGEALTQELRLFHAIDRVFFRSDSHYAVVICKDGVGLVWDLTPDKRAAAELVALAQRLTGSEIDDNQVVVPILQNRER